MSNHPQCTFCDQDIKDGELWIILNRYAVGTGLMGRQTTTESDVWDPDSEGGSPCYGGDLLHWPGCARDYIDGLFAELAVLDRRG